MKYRSRGALRTHEKFQCGKDPQVSCPFCPYKCKIPGNMKAHINNIHNPSAKLFKCKFCDHTVKVKGSLKIHVYNKHRKLFEDFDEDEY